MESGTNGFCSTIQCAVTIQCRKLWGTMLDVRITDNKDNTPIILWFVQNILRPLAGNDGAKGFCNAARAGSSGCT